MMIETSMIVGGLGSELELPTIFEPKYGCFLLLKFLVCAQNPVVQAIVKFEPTTDVGAGEGSSCCMDGGWLMQCLENVSLPICMQRC